jgi:hypothetical protein
MRKRPSNTAEDVATVRALLTNWGLLDDPYALRFLRPARRLVYKVLSHAKPTSLGRRAYAFILARTHIYDEFVRGAIDDGLRQVVIVGPEGKWRQSGVNSHPRNVPLTFDTAQRVMTHSVIISSRQWWCSASEDPGAQKWYCLLILRPRRTEPARRRPGLRTGVPTPQGLHA